MEGVPIRSAPIDEHTAILETETHTSDKIYGLRAVGMCPKCSRLSCLNLNCPQIDISACRIITEKSKFTTNSRDAVLSSLRISGTCQSFPAYLSTASSHMSTLDSNG